MKTNNEYQEGRGKTMKGLQIIWLWKPIFSFKKFDPEKTCWAYIYDWSLAIGFLQIRKWSTKKLPEARQ